LVDLTVSIVVNDNRELIGPCVESVLAAKAGLEVEVFVIDNASTDGSAEAVSERFPGVTLIRNTEKEGFSANHNKAIRRASGRYVLILNDDTVVRPDALKVMVSFMDAHPEAGACGAYLMNPDGTPQYTGKTRPTVLAALLVSIGVHKLFPDNRITSEYYGRRADYTDIEEVESVNGAAMMVRREAIDRAGPLDEGFFLFCEDVDWSIRIREAGYKLFFLPDAKVTHYRGASTGGRRIVWIYHMSLLRFYWKHEAKHRFFLVNWAVYSGIVMRLCLYLLYGNVRKKKSAG